MDIHKGVNFLTEAGKACWGGGEEKELITATSWAVAKEVNSLEIEK